MPNCPEGKQLSVRARGFEELQKGRCEARSACTFRACPPNKPGLFFYGSFQTEIPFGEGYLCITGNQHRLHPGVVTSPIGEARYAVDFTDPGSSASLIQPGMELNFQFWHRDPQSVGHGFNLSDALNAQFCP